MISGIPTIYNSSQRGRRGFCGRCGTGLFDTNGEFLPGFIDDRTVTADDIDALPPVPHIQAAERSNSLETADELPSFEGLPPSE